ncbi:hypothetical protein Ancab_034334 [Ancistrocladus abbreviatus]
MVGLYQGSYLNKDPVAYTLTLRANCYFTDVRRKFITLECSNSNVNVADVDPGHVMGSSTLQERQIMMRVLHWQLYAANSPAKKWVPANQMGSVDDVEYVDFAKWNSWR